MGWFCETLDYFEFLPNSTFGIKTHWWAPQKTKLRSLLAMETLNDRAANLLRSLDDLTAIKNSKLPDPVPGCIRSAMNKWLGLGIRGYAAFGLLAIADRRTLCRK